MRVLGRVRISRLTEQSTSVERQRELIEKWADMNQHTIVGWAEDLDLSGTVDPFDSPSLGPWLAEDKLHEWDILCAWKLDRISRRVIALNRVFGWMLEHEKTLVSVSENIDLSHWVGRLVANVIAGVAEGELEAIRERTQASRKKLLAVGRWPGGQVPYGLTPVPIPTGGWRLAIHPQQAEVINRIVDEVIAGSAIEAVANRLDEDGIPSPKGGTWLPSTLWKIVTGRYLIGHATYDGQTVRDHEGKPVLNAEPILSADRWQRLQDAVEARRRGPIRTRDTSPMLGVMKCYDCNENLFHKIYRRDYGKKLYRYYHCRFSGHCAQVDAEMVEEELEKAFLERVGDAKVMERVYRQAENHEIELEDARSAIQDITSMFGTMTSTTMRSTLTEQLRALDFRIRELESLPTQKAGWEYKETGQTFKTVWSNSNQEQRRQLLLRSGITYRITRLPGTQSIKATLYIPEEMLDLLNAKNPPAEAGG